MRPLPAPSLDHPGLDAFRGVADPDLVRRQGLFVAEGRRAVRKVLQGGWDVRALLLTEGAAKALADVLEAGPPTAPAWVVPGPAAMRAVTGHRLHQGCLAVVGRPPDREIGDLPGLDAARLVVVLEGVTDPDNVGTIFRSAAAFGAGAVVLGPGCAHPLYRKAVRASLGAALHTPFAHPRAWPDALAELVARGFELFALTPRADAVDLEALVTGHRVARAALLLGSEERGLSEDALRRCHATVRIGIDETVDSLNVAAAAAIALHRFRELLLRA